MLQQLGKTQRGNRGFSLIELMIVVAIIAILAAIAIPQFAAYRQRAYNAAAKSDLRNFKAAMTVDFGDHLQFDTTVTRCDVSGCATLSHGNDSNNALSSYRISNGVTIYTKVNEISFAAKAAHKSGNRQFGTASNTNIIYWAGRIPGSNDFFVTGSDSSEFFASSWYSL